MMPGDPIQVLGPIKCKCRPSFRGENMKVLARKPLEVGSGYPMFLRGGSKNIQNGGVGNGME